MVFVCVFFFEWYGDHRDLHSFPTRRSSDLFVVARFKGGKGLQNSYGRAQLQVASVQQFLIGIEGHGPFQHIDVGGPQGDRKSTRLNSSHVRISYAVFCLKKKKKTNFASGDR